MTYAGIGSRKTPPNILSTMQRVARILGAQHHQLRSGGAIGADRNFEIGAMQAVFTDNGPSPIIYTTTSALPWDRLTAHAKTFHPNWPALSRYGSYSAKLMARNSAIILGPGLDEPVDFVVTYFPDEHCTGGTSQGIRIATHHNIPIYNLRDWELTAEGLWQERQLHLPI